MSAMWSGRVIRSLSIAVVLVRSARMLGARSPLARATGAAEPITVVVPARDEADRIAPLLAALRGAPGVAAVIVVDDGSSDATADVASAAGATVVAGSEPPPGWTGKTWALGRGAEAAGTDWVVALDADVLPDPDLPRSVVERAIADRLDLLTVAGRFELASGAARCLHAAMLAQLVYRFGPPGTSRRLANGQCVAVRRQVLVDGLRAVSGELVEDVALARWVASVGGRVDFLDAADLMVVRPYGSVADVWSGWGRSIGLRGIEPRWRDLAEMTVLVATVVAPPVRAIRRSADLVDLVAMAVRVGTLAGMRRAYLDRGVAYWCSPIADPVAFVALLNGRAQRAPMWRNRRVGTCATPSRSAGRRRSSMLP